MFPKITHFLKYNNLATLFVVAVLAGGGSAFAASPALREATGDALVGREETVVAIDNGVLLSADLENFDPALVITAVSEDTESYYVSYVFNTIAVSDGAWRSAVKEGVLIVSKSTLGSDSLENYVSEELGEVARAEIAFLKEVQTAERKKGKTQTVIATAYTGLLGLIIDPKEKKVEQEPTPENQSSEPTEPVLQTPESVVVSIPIEIPQVNEPAPTEEQSPEPTESAPEEPAQSPTSELEQEPVTSEQATDTTPVTIPEEESAEPPAQVE